MSFYGYPLDGLGILMAALVYFILGAIWYAPFLFGQNWSRKDPQIAEIDDEKRCSCTIWSYIGEFIIALIMAFVLALFIEVAGAEDVYEGVVIAFWLWVGFIATTHFSAVLWGRKTVKHFFIHAAFMLIGMLAMGAAYMVF